MAVHVDLAFLAARGLGVVVSVVSLARLLEYLFVAHPVLLWAFFFGLILASIYYVAKTVQRWSAGPVILLLFGAAVAVGIALVRPASQNDHPGYMLVCGVVAISSMIIPGISGSFVLVLLGNYLLVLGAISDLNLAVLVPFGVGCVVGILALSHLLAWVFARYHDAAVGLITGFILGSLLLIWPWKHEVVLLDATGQPVLRKGESVIAGYDWFLPSGLTGEVLAAAGLMVMGVVLVVLMERAAVKRPG
jgi:putative membrane protein